MHNRASFQLKSPSPPPFFPQLLFLKEADLSWHKGNMAPLTVVAQGYDYAVVIMIVFFFQSQLNGVEVGYSSGIRMTALDYSDGAHFRYKHSAGTSTDKCTQQLYRESSDSPAASAGRSAHIQCSPLTSASPHYTDKSSLQSGWAQKWKIFCILWIKHTS